jgi:lipoate---protein ligase
MLCIAHSYTDPYFNLAAEEYLLHNFSQDCFMLWRNENTIVVGKHQNTLAEINMDYIREKKIRVVRRLSGGGTVYHDLGNLNFTFIMAGQEGHLVDFRKYTLPILEVLQKLSVDAKFEGRNDLTINGKKFSGNAEHVYKKRVLHHGTLLFSSVMEDLALALKVNPLKYKSKAVKSIRSRVTNIKEHLKSALDVMQFRDMILDHIMGSFPDSAIYEFTGEDINSINNLRREKYLTWEWNFGYSPEYYFERSLITNGGYIQVKLNVKKGIIKTARIGGDFLNPADISGIENILTGVKHDETELKRKLESFPFSRYFQNISAGEFIKGLF